MKNSSYSSLPLQTSAWPLTQPNSPTSLGSDRSGSVIAQLFPADIHSLSGSHCPCAFATSSLLSPCDFKHPGTLWCCSNLVWQGREPLTWLSPKNPATEPDGHWAWGCSRPHPHAGPRDFTVLKHSPYHLISQCPLQLLVSNLHICWDTIGCLLCSSEDWLGVSPMHREKWTPPLPMLPPAFPRISCESFGNIQMSCM